MTDDTTITPYSEEAIISALDLDRDNIQTLDTHHDFENGLIIELTLNPTLTECPICHTMTSKVKGYRLKKIRHSIFDSIPCVIHYNARRYVCPVCHKTFYENNHFTAGGSRMSVATVFNVLKTLKSPNITFTDVANRYNISTTSVIHQFDKHVSISRRPLPECINFDEVYAFHDKQKNSLYVCVLVDYNDKKVIDVLSSRRKKDLIEYFSIIPLEERKKVKYVSFDMWETYRIVSKLMFPCASLSVDKFHVLQELTRKTNSLKNRIINKYRKQRNHLLDKQKELKSLHKKLSPQEKEALDIADRNVYLLEKWFWLTISNRKDISNPNADRHLNRKLNRYLNYYELYDLVLKVDSEIEAAVDLRDSVHRFYRNCTYDNAKMELEELITYFRQTPIKELHPFADTLVRWKNEIINSFIQIPSLNNRKMNNALIENRNKMIKTLKTNANGYTCWPRFRNRILYCLNDDETFKI